MKRFVLGVSGASGGIYALRAVRAFLAVGCELHLVISSEGERVLNFETGFTPKDFVATLSESERNRLVVHPAKDLFAPIASGSFSTDGMLILPCSMASAAAIANGIGGDLVRRAADVHLKERRKLVVVFREAPLSSIHLRNLLCLSDAGAIVMPAAPAFYGKPEKIEDIVDFIVGRALTLLGVDNSFAPEWSN